MDWVPFRWKDDNYSLMDGTIVLDYINGTKPSPRQENIDEVTDSDDATIVEEPSMYFGGYNPRKNNGRNGLDILWRRNVERVDDFVFYKKVLHNNSYSMKCYTVHNKWSGIVSAAKFERILFESQYWYEKNTVIGTLGKLEGLYVPNLKFNFNKAGKRIYVNPIFK